MVEQGRGRRSFRRGAEGNRRGNARARPLLRTVAQRFLSRRRLSRLFPGGQAGRQDRSREIGPFSCFHFGESARRPKRLGGPAPFSLLGAADSVPSPPVPGVPALRFAALSSGEVAEWEARFIATGAKLRTPAPCDFSAWLSERFALSEDQELGAGAQIEDLLLSRPTSLHRPSAIAGASVCLVHSGIPPRRNGAVCRCSEREIASCMLPAEGGRGVGPTGETGGETPEHAGGREKRLSPGRRRRRKAALSSDTAAPKAGRKRAPKDSSFRGKLVFGSRAGGSSSVSDCVALFGDKAYPAVARSVRERPLSGFPGDFVRELSVLAVCDSPRIVKLLGVDVRPSARSFFSKSALATSGKRSPSSPRRTPPRSWPEFAPTPAKFWRRWHIWARWASSTGTSKPPTFSSPSPPG